jgi:hypothetical protein
VFSVTVVLNPFDQAFIVGLIVPSLPNFWQETLPNAAYYVKTSGSAFLRAEPEAFFPA